MSDEMKKRNVSSAKQISFSDPEAIEIQSKQKESRRKVLSSQVKVIVRSVREHLREYSEKTSLHGIQYVGERGRPLLERLCWFAIIGSSIYLCMLLIMQTWDKWNNRPVIVSFAYKPTAVWNIPFPAVTICPEVKSKQTVFNYTYQLDNSNRTEEEQEKLEIVSLLCDYKRYIDGNSYASERMLDIFEEVAPSFEETLLECTWMKITYDCSEMFEKTITAEGVCYTFNMLSANKLFTEDISHQSYYNYSVESDWTLDKGFEKSNGFLEGYPRRPVGVGNMGGLEVLLATDDIDYDYKCRGPTQGFKVVLHSPDEIPPLDQKFLMIPTNQDFTIAVKPEMTKTSSRLRSYAAEKRHCFFPDEKKLEFHKIYNADNCEMECVAKYIMQACNCVPFYMPHYNDTPICGSNKTSCATGEAQFGRIVNALNNMEDELIDYFISVTNFKPCACLQSCTSLIYNIETSQSDFDWYNFQDIVPSSRNRTAGLKVSRLNVFYKDSHFIPALRSELYGSTDFIANCGGLLGLFMGFSFISVVEIIYFLTFRIWCNITTKSRKAWAFVNLRKMPEKSEDSNK